MAITVDSAYVGYQFAYFAYVAFHSLTSLSKALTALTMPNKALKSLMLIRIIWTHIDRIPYLNANIAIKMRS